MYQDQQLLIKFYSNSKEMNKCLEYKFSPQLLSALNFKNETISQQTAENYPAHQYNIEKQ
jgi:hypothetical protein